MVVVVREERLKMGGRKARNFQTSVRMIWKIRQRSLGTVSCSTAFPISKPRGLEAAAAAAEVDPFCAHTHTTCPSRIVFVAAILGYLLDKKSGLKASVNLALESDAPTMLLFAFRLYLPAQSLNIIFATMAKEWSGSGSRFLGDDRRNAAGRGSAEREVQPLDGIGQDGISISHPSQVPSEAWITAA